MYRHVQNIDFLPKEMFGIPKQIRNSAYDSSMLIFF